MVSHTQSVWQVKWLFLRSQPSQGTCHTAESAQMAAWRCLPGPHASGRCLVGKTQGASLSIVLVGKALGSAWVCPQLSSPEEPAPASSPCSRAAALVRGGSYCSRERLCFSELWLCQRVVRPSEVPLLHGQMPGTLMLALTQPCRGKHSPGNSTPSAPNRKHTSRSSALETPLGRFFW